MATGKGKGGSKKTVTDLKNGRAKDDHQGPVDGDESIGDNSFEPSGETLSEYLEIIAREDDAQRHQKELLAEKAKPFKEKIKDSRQTQKNATKALVDTGYRAKELATITRQFR